MTAELAKYVSNNFSIVTQASGYASSFDATVWRGNAGTAYAGQFYVSMRGTQEAFDFSAKSVNGHSLGGYLASAFVRLFEAAWPLGLIDGFNSALSKLNRGCNHSANTRFLTA